MFLGDRVEKLRKSQFLGILCEKWPFLKVAKKKSDGPAQISIFGQNPFYHEGNFIIQP